jgi:hypothetical protein
VRQINRRAKRVVTGPDEYGSTYVYFRDPGTRSHRTLKHHGLVNLDYDKRGKLIGIELLAVPWELPK